VLALLVLLLGLTALAEETMFRGFLQTYLVGGYGAWAGILLAALLFGLRHLPVDIYSGLVTGASAASWLSRLVQLYSLALILGLVRHKASTWASWLVHEGVLVLILLLGILSSVQLSG
jgi:membrane protease YdiL (CAAX protease family)